MPTYLYDFLKKGSRVKISNITVICAYVVRPILMGTVGYMNASFRERNEVS